jgi:glycosyltransferase involved in cell wall biosynthesis
LPTTLEHLALQQVPKHISWELIIVDNHSTDGTAGVAEREWKKYFIDIPFQIVYEENPGLSYARRKGINTLLLNFSCFVTMITGLIKIICIMPTAEGTSMSLFLVLPVGIGIFVQMIKCV